MALRVKQYSTEDGLHPVAFGLNENARKHIAHLCRTGRYTSYVVAGIYEIPEEHVIEICKLRGFKPAHEAQNADGLVFLVPVKEL